MKRLFLVLAIVFMMVIPAWAKITPVRIVFGIDEAFAPFVVAFELNLKTSASGVFEHVATIDNLASRDWILTDIDIPPGQVVIFNVVAKYDPATPGGEQIAETSVDFPWKSTGQPFIISIQRQK